MNRKRIPQVLLVALLGSVALVGCKKKEAAVVTPPASTEPSTLPPAPAPAPAATASVTGLDLGTAVGADMKIGTPTSTFKPADTIYVSIATSTSDAMASVPANLDVKWTHLDSNQVVHQESRSVNLTGTGNTEFHISKPDGWPTGKYKVEVMLDGAPAQSREFEVR